MRYFYTLLFYLLLPFIFIRLVIRSRRLPNYRKRLKERLGYYPFKLEKCLWIHAVSVGETMAAVPLIKSLQTRYPDLPLLITTMTPTGAERVQAIFGDSVKHAYLPYDLPAALNRFINTMHPLACLIMETELWPNLLAVCHQKRVPVCLLNARLSAKSARGYQRIAAFMRQSLQQIEMIAAHHESDAKRFVALGAPENRVTVTGNIKFDLELPKDLAEQSEQLRASFGKERFVWIAASTHAGEEEIVLAAHKKLREKNPDALLILVPRHPDRFDAVAKLCEEEFVITRRAQSAPITHHTAIYLGDTMGELLLLYAASDVAFVGGSLKPQSGGHNLLEPALLAKALLTGPHLFNFAEISELLFSADALIKVFDHASLASALMQLMQNVAVLNDRGLKAKAVVDSNRGALMKQLALVNTLILSSVIPRSF